MSELPPKTWSSNRNRDPTFSGGRLRFRRHAAYQNFCWVDRRRQYCARGRRALFLGGSCIIAHGRRIRMAPGLPPTYPSSRRPAIQDVTKS